MITLAMCQLLWTAAASFHRPHDLSGGQGTGPAWCTTCGTEWPCLDAAALSVKLSAARHRARVNLHKGPPTRLASAFLMMGVAAVGAGFVLLLMLWNTALTADQTDTPIPLPAPSAQTAPR